MEVKTTNSNSKNVIRIIQKKKFGSGDPNIEARATERNTMKIT